MGPVEEKTSLNIDWQPTATEHKTGKLTGRAVSAHVIIVFLYLESGAQVCQSNGPFLLPAMTLELLVVRRHGHCASHIVDQAAF